MDMKGKVCFVTGAARGIGLALAECLLEKNAKVMLVDYDIAEGQKTENALKEKYNENVVFIGCDVTIVDCLKAAFTRTKEIFGHLDLVINCAGIVDEINFEKVISLNLTAVIQSSYLAIEYMRKDKGGNGGFIIQIASKAGFGGNQYLLTYCATKHGVVGFTRSLAKNLEAGNTGIQTAAICPHFVDTNMCIPEQFNLTVEQQSRRDGIVFPDYDQSSAFYQQRLKNAECLKTSQIVEGFLDLLSKQDINGTMLIVMPSGLEYKS